jgi:uncharacterized protein (DUF1697 family)
MATLVALLRAVNVGGTGKLPMSELKSICEGAGFENVRTYIASSNVVFKTTLNTTKAQALMEERLEKYAGKPVGVCIRTVVELQTILANNPFPDAATNHNMVIFLNASPPADTIEKSKGQVDEQIALGTREIYVHYDSGMGKTKFKIPAAKEGTARNMNTVAKLAEMAKESF